MPPRRRRQQQRRQENRNPPPPAVPAAPSNDVSVVRNIPDDPAGEPIHPAETGLQRFLRVLEAVKETSVEIIVDVAILLGKFFHYLGRGVKLLNMVTYAVLIVSTQLWLSISILENLVFLLVVSGVRFQFPLQHFAKFLVGTKEYLAWEFRLVVLSCVCIAFVEDALGKKPPVQRLKILWNLFFAQIIMYSFIPFMNNFADIMNVVLALVSCAAIAVESVSCTGDEVISSMNFLPHALMYHFLFISLLGTFFTYYELDKFFKRNNARAVVPVAA